MHSQPTVEAPGSPVAAIPERRPAKRSLLARGMSVLRGDKYMVGAYPPEATVSAAPGDGARSTTAPDEG